MTIYHEAIIVPILVNPERQVYDTKREWEIVEVYDHNKINTPIPVPFVPSRYHIEGHKTFSLKYTPYGQITCKVRHAQETDDDGVDDEQPVVEITRY